MGVYIPNMEHPKDGLYKIDHGKIHKYKGKGGTVRIYDLIEIPSELDVMTLMSSCKKRNNFQSEVPCDWVEEFEKMQNEVEENE